MGFQICKTVIHLKGVCASMISFVGSLLPTRSNREAASEATRPWSCLPADALLLEAPVPLGGPETGLCVSMDMPVSAYLTLVGVNAHPSVSLCTTHGGMENRANSFVCLSEFKSAANSPPPHPSIF